MENNLFVLTGQEEETTPYDWDGMPEYHQPDKDPYAIINVTFRDEEDMRRFAELLDQPNVGIPSTTSRRSAWYPRLDRGAYLYYRWVSEDDDRYRDCEEVTLP